jgi:hypothetical protein
VPAWDLQPGEAVEVKTDGACAADSAWQPAVMGVDGCEVLDASGAPLAARALRRPGEGSPDLLRVAPRCPLPETPDGRPARPNVLMFGDGEVDLARVDAQEGRFRRWRDAELPKGAKLAVVEVGAGLAVPTIRRLAEREASMEPTATLVRINLDDSQLPAALVREGRAVSVARGALDALQAIDALL